MPALPAGFNANEVEPTDFSNVPNGEYVAALVKAEIKTTKQGDGEYTSLDFQILEGPYKNRHLFENLNLVNKNATTVEIARGSLSAFLRALGLAQAADYVELYNLPVTIVVKGRKNKQSCEIEPKIVGYKSRKSGQQQSQAGAPGNAAPPWVRTSAK